MNAANRIVGTFIALLAGAGAPACSGDDSSASPTLPTPVSRIQIAGRVVDERSAQGVPAVTLFWGGASVGLSPITSVTDATGSYRVELPDAPFYSVSGDGVFPMSVVRPIGSPDIVNFYVNTGGCPTQYGRIVDVMTRRPIAGAHLTWVGVRATSDLLGQYRLSVECRPGLYGSDLTSVSVSHPGYQAYSATAPSGTTLGTTPSEWRTDIALTRR